MAPRISEDLLRELAAGRPPMTDDLADSGINKELLGGNEGKRRANSSLFNSLFSLLARPSRASASAINAIVDDDPGTRAFSEAVEALKGHRDTTFSGVLGNVGVENRAVKAIGGFAGDVLLDPLTYIGVKNIKGLSTSEARLRAVGELTERGANVTEDSVRLVGNELQKANPSHSYISFAGRQVTPSVTAPATAGRAVKEAVVGPEDTRRLLARVFSRRSELPFGMANKARVLEASNAGIFRRHQDQLTGVFGPLTGDEKRLIARSIEAGDDLSAVEASVKQHGLNSLGDYQRLAEDQFKRWFDDEAALGLYKPEQYNSRYLYKYYRNGLPERLPGLPAGAVLRGTKNPLSDVAAALESGTAAGTDAAEIASILATKSKTLAQAKKLGWDPVEEIDEILKMRAAKHYRTTARQQFVRDAVSEFGVDVTDANREYLLANKFRSAGSSLAAPVAQAEDLSKKWIPPQIARAINSTETILKDGQLGAEFVRFYDKILGGWKSLNTAWNPGYHVRNGMSDAIINFMDGVRNPTLYDRALRVQRGAKAANAGDLLGLGSIEDAGARINIGRHNKLSASEVWDLYLRGGSKAGYITAELKPQLSPLVNEGIAKQAARAKTGVQEAVQTAGQKITNAADAREDFFRLAHHIKAMEDNLPTGRVATPEELEKAAMAAGERVRKYNIDYGMLSSVEKNVARRVIPFYGWMRRNLPLQVELLFTKPGYMAAYPKGQDMIQGLMGSDDGEGDLLIPKWMRDLTPVRIATEKNENMLVSKAIRAITGAKKGEQVFLPLAGPQTPMGDLERLVSPLAVGMEENPLAGAREAVKTFANDLTPVIKAPVEFGTGRSLYTGGQIRDWKTWTASQFGPSRMAAKALTDQRQSLASGLLGLSLQPVTAERQLSEFKRREDVVDAQSRRQRTEFAAQYGLPEDSPFLNRFPTPEQQRAQRWKQSNKSILRGLLPDENI